MLDIKFIRENADLVKKNAKNKGIEVDVDRLLRLDEKRRKLINQIQTAEAAQNKANQVIARALGAEKKKLIGQMKKVAEKIGSLKSQLQKIEQGFDDLMGRVPQIASPESPVGPDESLNKQLYQVGKPPKFKFKPRDHIALAEHLDIVDFKRGVKVIGNRGYYLKGDGALLEWALLRYALDFITQRGFTILSVPVFAPDFYFFGTGYLPWGRDEVFYVYERDKHTYNLVGSSEVTLCAYYANEILSEKELPQKLAAWSPCFRTEVGSYGKETHGLYRVKQFYKVEQVVICKDDPEVGERLHQELIKNAEDFLKTLELPYQVTNVCTGDMGAGKVKMYDIETWMPSLNKYSETHSASYLGDWQARRLKIRYKDKNGKTKFAHTLNNTLIATPRIFIPLLEIHQNEDGSVNVPQALRKYLDGKSVIKPAAGFVPNQK